MSEGSQNAWILVKFDHRFSNIIIPIGCACAREEQAAAADVAFAILCMLQDIMA